MLSVHPSIADPQTPWHYAAGFRDVSVDNLDFIARIITKSVWSGICWKEGKRKQDLFMLSDWCVLDFDEPGFSLDEACRTFCDRIHIIGTTKSHQREKAGISCDRFRVALRWEQRISELHVYKHNMRLMAERYPLDEKALDGARYFFPCKEIVQKNGEGFFEEVEPAPPSEDPKIIAQKKNFKRAEYNLYGKLPGWINRFLTTGELVKGGGVNNTIYAASLELFDLGHTYDQITEMILNVPTHGAEHPVDRIARSVRSAERRFQQLQRNPK